MKAKLKAKFINRSLEDKILLTLTATATLGLLPFLIFGFQLQDQLAKLIAATAIFGLSCIFIGLLFSRKTTIFSALLAIFTQIIILAAIYLKGANLIYWAFPAVVASFYLLPALLGGAFNSIMIVNVFFIANQQLDTVNLYRILITLVLTNLFALAFSMFMQKKNRLLSDNVTLSQSRNKLLELIASSNKLTTILSAIVKEIEYEFPNVRGSILLLDGSGKHLTLGAAPSLPDFFNQAVDGMTIGHGAGSCGTAAFTKKRVIVSDIANHPYWSAWKDLAKKANIAACWSEPIIDSNGTLLGTFALYHEKVATPTKRDFIAIEQITNIARIAIERERADNIIWQQANYDNLTLLPNRNLMHEHLMTAIANAQRDKSQLAVVMLDLDNFKDVNDSLGHSTGDKLLIQTSRRIKSCLRKNDIVARLGGDEFVIILVGTNSTADIDNIGQKLLSSLSQPYQIEQKSVYCAASLGIALYPNDADNIDALLRNADQAMYGAKARGRNSIHYFTEQMRTDFLKRMEIIQNLRSALNKQQFHMVYQPIVDLTNNKIIKAEALIRWQHPEIGAISPLDFIPLAEETGLICDISDWIFNQVSQQVKHWREHYCPELMISINTSPVQYRNQGRQITNWAELLKKQGLEQQAIAIEITENLLMENQSQVISVLDQVRQQGVAIAIDDFGTGYCSFSYLKNYTIDYLKIDKSFVQNMATDNKDAALCQAIIVMANKLGIDVIAEGIETEQQKQLLMQAGCHLGQGYLLAKPMKQQEFEQLLIQEQSKT
ncbi:diguanylate cyclase (GGDEF) domain-containing protein [Colwellia chukchiensis]|uniref:Diguanylate cyclase (GGDEF) domain-containing protein n=1 Tax=Colwellia chukchiensis TaxID=641665 RepID=A0A1H7KI81_9GAMM|nr:EAL domain-containing protein [Colwellia chukchiensis]SEK86498.1 diguanylate cyclase (GGDEF) domain-containing protein [Colwellia chukchiensis]